MTTLLQILPMAHVVISAAVRATFWMAHPALSAQHRDSGQSQHQYAEVGLTGLQIQFLVTGQHTEIHIPAGSWLQPKLCAVSLDFPCDLPCLRTVPIPKSKEFKNTVYISAKNRAKDRKVLDDS